MASGSSWCPNTGGAREREHPIGVDPRLDRPEFLAAEDSELSGYRFIDPPRLRAARTRAEADERVDRRAGPPLELLDRVALG